jgi:hypothetical protein
VAALEVAPNGHIFAGTYSLFGEGGGMFRSTDNGATWTEQNNGFSAHDVNDVTTNSPRACLRRRCRWSLPIDDRRVRVFAQNPEQGAVRPPGFPVDLVIGRG